MILHFWIFLQQNLKFLEISPLHALDLFVVFVEEERRKHAWTIFVKELLQTFIIYVDSVEIDIVISVREIFNCRSELHPVKASLGCEADHSDTFAWIIKRSLEIFVVL